MKNSYLQFLIITLLCGTSFSTLFAQSEQEQRIKSSYLMVFGRAASDGEVTYWKSRGNLTTAQLFDNHRQYFVANKSIQREMIIKSYNAAFGRNPSEGEINYYIKGNLNYTELMTGHTVYLVKNTSENEASITRAYQYVLKRKPTADELSYGRVSGGCSYLFWVGWLQDTKHSGTKINVSNAPVLVTVNVSQIVANEVKLAGGLSTVNGGNIIAAGAGNMVAAGGGNIVAAGGGNIVAAGGGN